MSSARRNSGDLLRQPILPKTSSDFGILKQSNLTGSDWDDTLAKTSFIQDKILTSHVRVISQFGSKQGDLYLTIAKMSILSNFHMELVNHLNAQIKAGKYVAIITSGFVPSFTVGLLEGLHTKIAANPTMDKRKVLLEYCKKAFNLPEEFNIKGSSLSAPLYDVFAETGLLQLPRGKKLSELTTETLHEILSKEAVDKYIKDSGEVLELLQGSWHFEKVRKSGLEGREDGRTEPEKVMSTHCPEGKTNMLLPELIKANPGFIPICGDNSNDYELVQKLSTRCTNGNKSGFVIVNAAMEGCDGFYDSSRNRIAGLKPLSDLTAGKLNTKDVYKEPESWMSWLSKGAPFSWCISAA